MCPSTDEPPAPSRREFLSSSSRVAGGGWLALNLPLLAALSACSREAAERGEPLRTLSTEEGEAVAALAETIFPSDGLPGAREAGVVHFVDRALGELFPEWLGVIRPGLAGLDERAGAQATSFAALPEDRREEVVREVEETPFFFVARMLVVMGMFSDPAHGGNLGHVGWELLGMAHAPAYEPPFGHYDAEYRPDAGAGDGGEDRRSTGAADPGGTP